ncbi:DUF1566 domain-containing protein [Cellvibrio sp. pealriver]|uniref:Lcl C-terminal domain-containing protein n=1 Tax=Cellvibrio sp. pealriver TaxID=1622269 RepID=UPI00066FD53E|nr:DUF1566 domain-containing protein [Cellvibrio sp. pealriver]
MRVAAGNNSVTLSWFTVNNADSYNLYYSIEPNIDPSKFGQLAALNRMENVTPSFFTLNNLQNGTRLYFVVTALNVLGESPPSDEVSAIPQPLLQFPVRGSGKINDTGVDWCADIDFIYLTCPQADFFGQDGDYGRDAQYRSGYLVKIGSGTAGFDFTKIDANGNELPDNAEKWSCVLDNVTNLLWEEKTSDGGLRDANNYYTWYDPNPASNGGDEGVRNQGSCVGSDCDTFSYLSAVNSQGLCGFNDWSIPTINELKTIINYGRIYPATDVNFFRNAPPSNYFNWTWSSSTGTGISVGLSAWGVEFSNGHVNLDVKRNFGRIRLVRQKP